jgi:ribonuclease-3
LTGVSVVLRTQSDVEAHVARALLETHGIRAFISSDVTHAVFPLAIDGLGEVRLSVREDEAERATLLLDDYRAGARARADEMRSARPLLERRLDYAFSDPGLIEQALTHRSRAHEDETGAVEDNESLEFLGDAVLGLIMADRLFREFPDYDEGRKSKARAQLVSAATLAEIGERLQLGDHLLLGRGEEKTGGRRKRSLIADAFEAVVGAIYLDGGYEAAAAFLERAFRPRLERLRQHGVTAGTRDHKSELQEWLQARAQPLPQYRLSHTTGPDHRKEFAVEVLVGERLVATGSGQSKKEAEREAARQALAVLGDAAGGEDVSRSR